MSEQYLRKFQLYVGDNSGNGLDLSDLRCKFQIRRGDTQSPNSCDVRVYNMADATASRIQNEFTALQIQAGYEGSYGVVFTGTIKQVRKGREDARTTFVDITAADGDEAYNFAPCSFSMAAGTNQQNSVQALIGTLINNSVNQELSAQKQLPSFNLNGRVRARAYYGLVRDELRDFCQSNDLKWSIQDGVITLIPLFGYLPGAVPVLSPDTGVVGVPEQTQNGIEIRTLLNPNLKVGQLVKLDSTTLNLLRYGLDTQSQGTNLALQQQVKTNADGLYYVMTATHDGDTRGNDWYSNITCLATDGTITGTVPVSAAIPATGIARN